MGVMDVVLVSLLIQEVEHVFDSQGKRAATVSSAEDGLKEVVYKFLEGALLGDRRREECEIPSGKRILNFGTPLKTEYAFESGPESVIESGSHLICVKCDLSWKFQYRCLEAGRCIFTMSTTLGYQPDGTGQDATCPPCY